MTTPTTTWRDLFQTGGLALVIISGGTSLQALEAFITSAMLPTVVGDIGGLELFAWNTTIFIVASFAQACRRSTTCSWAASSRGH